MKQDWPDQATPLKLTDAQRENLSVLFVAKHALSGGKFDSVDGSHAVYHDEILRTLRGLGLKTHAANSFEALFEKPDCNYLFSLYNRVGFRNSEVLANTLAEYHGIAYLGAYPSIRGVVDDKNLSKHLLRSVGVRTEDWVFFGVGQTDYAMPDFAADGAKVVVKPNNSSASWGIKAFTDWGDACAHIAWLQEQNCDVVVEAFAPGANVTVPVIGASRMWVLPPVEIVTESDDGMYTFEQFRGHEKGTSLRLFERPEFYDKIVETCRAINDAIWPFDYGRHDFRLDLETGELSCLEMNLICNLGSTRGIARSAASIGVSHPELIESIIAYSLNRHGMTFE